MRRAPTAKASILWVGLNAQARYDGTIFSALQGALTIQPVPLGAGETTEIFSYVCPKYFRHIPTQPLPYDLLKSPV